MTDQRQVVHAYDFDLLGRQTQDRVTSLGGSSGSSSSSSSSSSGGAGGVDGTVQRIGRTFEVRGLLQNVTSYSSPIVGQGTVVNDVQRTYNSFEQLITEYQEHGGAVNTSTSVNVQYQYASGSANTVRQTAVIYPSGRLLNLSYGASGGMDDALSRVSSLIDNDGVTHLADYTRLGLDTVVQQSSPQPQIAWSLINGSGIDPYTGLDQFNRVVDNRWYSTGTNTDLDRVQHGYDRAGNRLWRQNTVAEAAGANLDELYTTDGLYRLKELQRGQLSSSDNAIVGGTLDFAQAWGLDATGNWGQFWENDTGGSWNLQQTRTANLFNEITSITGGGWAQPAYDAAGNMVSMPQPASPAGSYSATYDAWNRLMSLSSSGSLVCQNTYDSVNRRVTELVSGTMRHFYYTDQWQDLEERLGTSASPDRQFVWGLRYIDNLVLRDRGTERLYSEQDPNWSVTAIVTSSGTTAERYAYAAYGQPVFMNGAFSAIGGSAFGWETAFAGYRFESDIDVFTVRLRDLHCLLGTWLVADPVFYESGDFNLYRYAHSNPIRSTDPFGTTTVLAGCGIGAIWSGVGGFVGNISDLFSNPGFVCKKAACAAAGGCVTGAVITAYPGFGAGCVGGVLGNLVTMACEAVLGCRGPLGTCDVFNTVVGGILGCIGGKAGAAGSAKLDTLLGLVGINYGVWVNICSTGGPGPQLGKACCTFKKGGGGATWQQTVDCALGRTAFGCCKDKATGSWTTWLVVAATDGACPKK